MKVNCTDHRNSMELLGLQLRLKEGISDPHEKKQVEERVQALEQELGIN
ncbi:MAG: hypothetical protein JRK53_17215 [Deltaproteobacteria bacterium]|nr:hypothetical protein [Deltaproteobacteria bacterium]MBW1815714.1 hypothetical protein [Deltaproteobacteria bacterium]MBW2283503.1 hypothetical protein [Deltaproteobacteria bacterium]